MIRTLFAAVFALGSLVITPAPLYAQMLESDLAIFQSCYPKPATGACVVADFNGDGYVNTLDLMQFRSSYRGDFDGNGTVDLREVADNSDLAYLDACIGYYSQVDCTPADLNSDGGIDFADREAYFALRKYDLNADGYIVFQANYAPQFQYLSSRSGKELAHVLFYVWALDEPGVTLSYSMQGLPSTAALTPVIMGDFNADNLADATDSALLQAAMAKAYNAQYDINNDGVLDQADVALMQSLLGRSVAGGRFDWSPGRKDSGFYPMTAVATDQYGLAGRQAFTLTIYDVDARTNYYAYDDVMLVVNDASAASLAIGTYFATARAIPNARIVHINTAETETISRAVFDAEVRDPVASVVCANRWKNQNYLVTTKGVPLRVAATAAGNDNAAVDSELALLCGPHANRIGTTNGAHNPYYGFDYPFSREMFGVFLVTRLTGYKVNDVLSLIDRSAQAAQTGTFVFDVDPARDAMPAYAVGNQWLRGAAAAVTAAGHPVLLDETTTFVTGQVNVLGYASWGSNDTNAFNHAIPGFSWLPGSIAETFVSTSARTFTAPAVYGQSLIADLIAEGVTGARGYVYEPYLSAMARPNVLFDRYSKGYVLADSYYAASLDLGWQGVVVGDPKMAISLAQASVQALACHDDDTSEQEPDDSTPAGGDGGQTGGASDEPTGGGEDLSHRKRDAQRGRLALGAVDFTLLCLGVLALLWRRVRP